MARELKQREKRTLIVGAISAVAILAFTFGTKGFDRWQEVRASLKSARAKLKEVTLDEAKQAGLLSIVPVAELPGSEDKQKFLFRDKLHEQLKKAGIKTEPLTILPSRKKAGIPYRVLLIKCKGKCNFEQLLDFLAALNENPYLVGIEELRFRCDTKKPPDKRKEVEIDLTVSTFVEPSEATQQARGI
jgi:hypothetical protein